MFGFGKKKDKTPKKEEIDKVELTLERKEELLRIISLKKEKVNKVSGEELAKVFEEIGLMFNEIGEENQAINYLENSIQAKKSLGDGYKTLLKLYNKKRTEAAKANNDEILQVYLKKMDEMMQVSKDVTRGVQ